MSRWINRAVYLLVLFWVSPALAVRWQQWRLKSFGVFTEMLAWLLHVVQISPLYLFLFFPHQGSHISLVTTICSPNSAKRKLSGLFLKVYVKMIIVSLSLLLTKLSQGQPRKTKKALSLNDRVKQYCDHVVFKRKNIFLIYFLLQ